MTERSQTTKSVAKEMLVYAALAWVGTVLFILIAGAWGVVSHVL
jgi:hypothetical protein